MTKSAQSLLELFNLLSGETTFVLFKSPVTNHEAQSLYKLWSGDKDEYGRIRVPDDVDSSIIRSLADKKLLRNVDLRLATQKQPLIEITEEGQKIIRDIILYAEKSSYEGGIKNINYEEIYRTTKFGPIKQAKVASLEPRAENWLQELWQRNRPTS
jgi:hypothetical protein